MATKIQANLLVDKGIYDKFRTKMIETNHSRKYAETVEKLMILYVQKGDELFEMFKESQ